MTEFVCFSRAVIIIQGQKARVVSGDRNWPSEVDEIFCRGMIQRVKDFGRDGGLLMGFSKQFQPPFREWFGKLPRRLLFVRLTPVLERKAEEVLILVPYTWSALFAGQHRLITAVSTASSLVRVWTMAARSRFLSSDVVLTSQRSLKESEHELNEVVHRVNNVAQDVSIQCEELQAYGDYLSFQFGTRFDFRCRGVDDISVLVASRELLEACLRMAMRLAYRERDPDIIARVTITEDDDEEMVVFMVEDNGTPLSEETRARGLEEKFAGVVEEPDYLRALVNLARLRGGEMSFISSSEEFANGVALRLPLTREEETARIPRGDWVLLVDDNPDVTTFYARIIDAMELPHETADSLGEAREVLARAGRPKLVITDVQLGDGSGLELVQEVRSRYGPHLPVFVVSGETDTDLVSRVKSAGADLYLTKPVGRRKLFAEIRNILR
jgi:two-component system chemotaxis response regulator CheY